MNFKKAKEQFEMEFLCRALYLHKGMINQTAIRSGIPKKTLLRKLKKYNLKAEQYK